MAFSAATVLTAKERAIVADRFGTPATYTNPPKFIGVGTGATAAARTAVAADTALSTEVETRTAGTQTTVTTTLTGDTSQVVGTITMTAARAVDEGGLFDAASAGNMAVSWTQLIDSFSIGDTYTITVKIQWL
jgi:hypothetical protein